MLRPGRRYDAFKSRKRLKDRNSDVSFNGSAHGEFSVSRARKPETAPPSRRAPNIENEIAILRGELREVREMIVELLQHHGYERAGARGGKLLLEGESRISMEEAAKVVWGKSVAKDPESLQNHAEILKIWATKGLNGVVLETVVSHGRWYTSREAVKRFQQTLRR